MNTKQSNSTKSYRTSSSNDDAEEGEYTSTSDHERGSNGSCDESTDDDSGDYYDWADMNQEEDDNDKMFTEFNFGLQELHINQGLGATTSATERHTVSKINKNPQNLKVEQVQTMVAEGILVPGPPPEKKRCTSGHWKEEIIFFLFDAKTGKELEHWFYCAKCYWVHNCILRDGNKTIRDHAEKHRNERSYEFDRMQLANLLANATKFGASNGNIPITDFVKHLPFPNKWSEQFWQKLNCKRNDELVGLFSRKDGDNRQAQEGKVTTEKTTLQAEIRAAAEMRKLAEKAISNLDAATKRMKTLLATTSLSRTKKLVKRKYEGRSGGAPEEKKKKKVEKRIKHSDVKLIESLVAKALHKRGVSSPVSVHPVSVHPEEQNNSNAMKHSIEVSPTNVDNNKKQKTHHDKNYS